MPLPIIIFKGVAGDLMMSLLSFPNEKLISTIAMVGLIQGKSKWLAKPSSDL